MVDWRSKMGIFLFKKNTLRCPKCGGYYDKNDGFTICFDCGEKLISEDEYQSYTHPSTKPVVTCPYCQSTDTKKISTSSKIANTAVFGIFSMSRNSKNYHCNKCGSDF